MANLFHLKRSGVSVLIETSASTPSIVHWGRELTDRIDEESVLSAIQEPTPHCDFDDPQLVGVYRENARGFLGAPSIIGSRDGLDFSQLFTLRDLNQVSEFEIEFISIDAEAELEVATIFLCNQAVCSSCNSELQISA